jgi:hypothetical protein
MPISVVTNSPTALNGVVAANVYPGCFEKRILESGGVSYGEVGVGNVPGENSNTLLRPYGLVNIPRDATINSATLHIQTTGVGVGNPTIASHVINVDAAITDADWTNYSVSSAWTVAGGASDVDAPSMSTQVVGAGSTFYTLDITAFVERVVQGEVNLQLMLLTQDYDNNDGFWFLEQLWQVEVDHTGGIVDGNLPIDRTPIDFTGTDGDPIPAPLIAFAGTFQITSNRLDCINLLPATGGAIGAFVGYDTGSANGTVSATYNANTTDGGASTGVMFRHQDNNNFFDVIDTGGTISLARIVDNGIGIPGSYVVPGYSNVADIAVRVELEGDSIVIFVNEIEAINVIESTFNTATVHGSKYGGVGPLIDDLLLPSVFAEPPDIINATFRIDTSIDGVAYGLYPAGDFMPPAVTEVSYYVTGHSLFTYTGGDVATPTAYTVTGQWLNLLAQANSNLSSGGYTFGFTADQIANWPPASMQGKYATNSSDPWLDTETFAEQDLTHVIYMLSNFFEYVDAPSVWVPEGLTHIDNILAGQPNAEIIIYEHWPDAGPIVNIDANLVTTQEWQNYRDAMAVYHQWHSDYQDLIIAARPNATIRMIPVGPIINDLIENEAYLSTLVYSDLYGDNAPHGTENTYLLAGMICERALFKRSTNIAGFSLPGGTTQLSTEVTNNLQAIADYVETRLDFYNTNGVNVY